ncbi:MAG: septum formation family protein [Pseudoclavibacter sp.]|nr:septum formation family protein [Pseudoclavibacter sp.]
MTAPVRLRRLAVLLTAPLLAAPLAGCTLGGLVPPEQLAAREAASAEDPGRDASYYDLEIGSCFDLPNKSAADVLLYESCDTPHAHEVFHRMRLPDDQPPEGTAFNAFVSRECRGAFAGYVGTEPRLSHLGFSAVVPSRASWEEGDREVLCLLEAITDRELVGSARGSGQ